MKDNQATIEQLEATNKVYELRQGMNDNELSALLKISKVTLYARFKKSNWTEPEILFIEYRSNPEFEVCVDSLRILKK